MMLPMSKHPAMALIPSVLAVGLATGLLAQTTPPSTARSTPPQASGRAKPPAAPLSAEQRWRRANDAWNDGKYPDALRDLKALMQGVTAAEYRDRIALLTGELLTTTEITADGRNPKMSANGQYLSYEAGPATNAVTRVMRLGGATPQQVTELSTTTVAFDPASTRLAWLRAGAAAGSTEIVVRDLASGTDRVVVGAGLLKTGLTWSGDGRSILFLGGETTTR
jgi:hypothetical protein